MRHLSIFTALATMATLLPATAQQTPDQYTITDLGGPFNYGRGVNDSGSVVGYNTLPNGVPAPVDTTLERMGSQSVFYFTQSPLGGTSSRAYAINFGEDVVGESQVMDNSATHAFLSYGNLPYQNLDLGTLGGTNSTARALNDNRDIVGWADLAGDTATHAFRFTGRALFNGGQVQDLRTLGGTNSYGEAVAFDGITAGYSQTAGNAAVHAFLYDSTMHDLGTLGGLNSRAYGLRDDYIGGMYVSQVVGASDIAGNTATHAFVYDAVNNFTDLGVLPGGVNSYAKAINDNGKIVGYSGVHAGTHAFLYQNAMLNDLNDLIPQGTGWELQHAEAISDSDLITGYGTYFGQTHAFLLQTNYSATHWAASAIAAAPDGGTALLWNNFNGSASVWTVDASFNTTYSPIYGPYAAWKAQGVGVSTDGLTHLLWTNTDGSASVWKIDGAGTPTYGPTYGPYAGWTAKKIAAGANGSVLLLWANQNGAASYWNIVANGAVTYSPIFGPFTNGFPAAVWSAVGIAGSVDGNVRLLWDSADGAASFWQIDSNGTVHYGPTYFYDVFQGIGVGADGITRVLLPPNLFNGQILSLSVDSLTPPDNQDQPLGPFPGWTTQALSVGTDNVAHVLWTNVDGSASFWTFGPDEMPHYSPIYGPY